MGVKHPCIHGELCRAYMQKYGCSYIYNSNCPNCRFYEPDYRFECDYADSTESTMSISDLFKRKHVAENDSPPCITCVHCVVEREFDYSGLEFIVHKCELTPSNSGVMFAPCSKARNTKFCKYEGDCLVARYINEKEV